MQSKNTIYIIFGGIIIIAIVIVAYFTGLFPKSVFKKFEFKPEEKPRVVEENLVIPDTEKIIGSEGRIVTEGPVAVSLVPKTEGEKVIVAKAVLTVKGSYDLALPDVQKWSKDAKLVFVKSLGAVTLEGKSSMWQLAYSSKTKPKKGYEIIVQGDQIVSQKEVDSTAKGVDFPVNMPDSGEFVKKLQERPAYSDATLSGFLFASTPESTDVKWWFSVSTSKGTVTFEVR